MSTDVDVETGEVTEAREDFPIAQLASRFVTSQQGRQYVLYAGLVDCLHQLSTGYFSIDTRLEQVPSAENGQVAICSARVQVCAPGQPDLVVRSATGIGDASPENVGKLMTKATIRMAETRAKARALRDLLNIGMVALEELESQEPAAAPPPSVSLPVAPATTERIQVGDRAYSRPEVLAAYRRRLQEAKAAAIVLPPGTAVREDAPLPELVGASQALRRAVEAAAHAAASVAAK